MRSIPLFLHADEAEYAKNKKAYVVSISGLAGGDPSSTKFLVAVVPSARMVKHGKRNRTLDVLMQFVRWSFDQLLAGQWPATMWRATP